MIDLKGKKFGLLTVVQFERTPKQGKIRWMCVCGCGNRKSILGQHLRSGKIISCGCLRKKLNHGYSRTKTYKAWQEAKSRCSNPKRGSFKDYGGRGITMCERWKSNFPSFLEDMGERPSGFSLERKDVNGNYEPGNCRWIPKVEQGLNKRNSVFAT